MAIFEQYFDRLFNTGEIDPMLENEFIFQRLHFLLRNTLLIYTRFDFWIRLKMNDIIFSN